MHQGVVAAAVFEVGVVYRHDLAEHTGLDLLHEVVKEVAVDEAAFRGVVGVQVEVEG